MKKSITEKFIDYESKLLVVREELLIPNMLGAKVEYLTTYNSQDFHEVTLEQRKGFIDYGTKIGIDSELEIEWKKERIQTLHGCEIYLYEVRDFKTNQILKFRKRAFNSKKQKLIPQLYKEQLVNPTKEKIYWWENYSIKLYKEREGIWFKNLWYNTRGQNYKSHYHVEWLKKVQIIEPEIVQIIENLLPTIFFDETDLIEKFKENLRT